MGLRSCDEWNRIEPGFEAMLIDLMDDWIPGRELAAVRPPL